MVCVCQLGVHFLCFQNNSPTVLGATLGLPIFWESPLCQNLGSMRLQSTACLAGCRPSTAVMLGVPRAHKNGIVECWFCPGPRGSWTIPLRASVLQTTSVPPGTVAPEAAGEALENFLLMVWGRNRTSLLSVYGGRCKTCKWFPTVGRVHNGEKESR